MSDLWEQIKLSKPKEKENRQKVQFVNRWHINITWL